MYTLILWFVALGSPPGGAAMSTIDGFRTEKECYQAANAWYAEMERFQGDRTYRATCVKVK